MSHANRKFNLIEIAMVLGFVGLIAALLYSSVHFPGQAPRVAQAKAGLQKITTAIQNYRQDTGSLPHSLKPLTTKPANVPNWKGPYLRSTQLNDPWGTEYQYRSTGRHETPFEVISFGSDGAAGGTGYAGDLSNRDWRQ